MKKRIGVILLSVLMLFSFVMVSCKDPTKPQLIELVCYSQLANSTDEQLGFFKVLLEDKFNVKLNIVADTEGVYDARMEAGNLGDIVVWGSNGAKYQNAIKRDMLFPWEEMGLLDNYGKNLKKYFSTALEANRAINSQIGPEDKYKKIYGIGHNVAPSAEDHESFFYSWDIRWDLYKKLGYPEVNDLDDYITVLKAMQELEPYDESGRRVYAMSPFKDWDGNMVMNVKSFASSYYGYDEFQLGLYDAVNGVFHDALEEGGPYLTALNFFYQLNKNGLLDPDAPNNTWNSMAEKVKNGGVLASTFDFSGSLIYNSVEHLKEDKMMAPLVPKEANVITYGLNVYGGERVWSIGARTRYPEKCMEIIDWLASPEGAMSIWYGLRGVHWDYDEEGRTYFTEFGDECRRDPYKLQNGVKWTSPYTGKTYELSASYNDGKLQINNIIWSMDATNPDTITEANPEGEKFKYDYWRSQQTIDVYEIEQDWRDFTDCMNMQEYMRKQNYIVIPASNYAESPKPAGMDIKWNEITKSIKRNTWKAMFAKSDLEFAKTISDMRKECYALDYEACVEWCRQEALRKWPPKND